MKYNCNNEICGVVFLFCFGVYSLNLSYAMKCIVCQCLIGMTTIFSNQTHIETQFVNVKFNENEEKKKRRKINHLRNIRSLFFSSFSCFLDTKIKLYQFFFSFHFSSYFLSFTTLNPIRYFLSMFYLFLLLLLFNNSHNFRHTLTVDVLD